MEKFLSTILTVIIILWILRWVFKLIGPWLLRLFAKRLMKKAGFDPSAFGGEQSEQSHPKGKNSSTETKKSGKWWKEDNVILKPSRKNGQRISDILGGEYIDYEESSAS